MIPAPLVYALAGAGLLWAGHRLVRPMTWGTALLLLMLPLAFTGKALLTGRVFGPLDIAYQAPPLRALMDDFGVRHHNAALHDTHTQLTPWGKAVRWAYAQGEWPLWNPFMFCGDILAASSSPGPYDPANLATLLAPLPDRLGLTASISMLFAGLAMWLFLRELGCRDTAALLGAAAWMFCDFRIFWIGLPQTPTVAGLPLVLLAVRRLVRDPGWPHIALLAAALSLVVLPGHPETTAHVVLLGAIYGSWLLWTGRAERPFRRWWPPLGAALAAGALALLLTAIHLLPLLDAIEQSIQHAQRSAVFANLDRSAPWSELGPRVGHSFAPFLFGPPGFGMLPPAPPALEPAGGYAGSLLLPLAFFGLVATRARERWILLALGLLGLLASASAPVVADLLATLPPFDIAINERLGFAWAFAVAALAALGAEGWAAQPDRPRLARYALAVFVGLTLLSLALAPFALGGLISAPRLTGYAAWSLLPLVALWAIARAWRPADSALAAIGLLLVVQRVGEMGDVYPTFPRAAFFPRPPVLGQLPPNGGADGAQPYRVVGRGYTLIPNAAAMWELEDPRGYQAITHQRLARTLPLWSMELPVSFNMVPDLADPFLSFLNVRYAIADPAAGRTRGWVRRYHGDDASLFENLRVLPRAFVPQRVRTGGSSADVLGEMAVEKNFQRRAWIEIPGAPAGAIAGRRNGPGSVRTERDGSGYQLDADMQKRGWVVMSVTHWRGWRAILDEREELPLAFGNHAFLAFEVPAGEHRVRLFFRPASFVWGRALSFGTLALLILAGAVTAIRRRFGRGRRSPAPAPA